MWGCWPEKQDLPQLPGPKHWLEMPLSQRRYDEALDWCVATFGKDIVAAYWSSETGLAEYVFRTPDQALLCKLAWGGQ